MIRDTEIKRRIRQGDKSEFESLFRSSYISLVRFAKTIVKDHDTAEEIVQDLFFRIWKDREKIKINTSLNGYLFRSVHNSCLHWIEHTRVVEKHAHETIYRQEDSPANPGEIIQFKELQAKIADILDKLPDRCGKIFYMNRFEGLKYSEIAGRLSVSVKTVEADMGKALKEFRKALTE